MCYEKQSFSASDNEGVLIGILCLRCLFKELTDWLCHDVNDHYSHGYYDSLSLYLKEHPMLAHKSRLESAIGQRTEELHKAYMHMSQVGLGSPWLANMPTGTNLQS